MKRVVLIVFVSAIVAAATSFFAARCCLQRPSDTVEVHDADWLAKNLGLSDAQAAEVAKLEASFRAEVEACCRRHCNALVALSEQLALPSTTAAGTTNDIEQMCAAYADVERATINHIFRVRELLTADQRARYATLICEQIQTACPLGMHKKH